MQFYTYNKLHRGSFKNLSLILQLERIIDCERTYPRFSLIFRSNNPTKIFYFENKRENIVQQNFPLIGEPNFVSRFRFVVPT